MPYSTPNHSLVVFSSVLPMYAILAYVGLLAAVAGVYVLHETMVPYHRTGTNEA